MPDRVGLQEQIQVSSIQPADSSERGGIVPSGLLPWELQARFLGQPLTLKRLESLGARCRNGRYMYTYGDREYILNLQP